MSSEYRIDMFENKGRNLYQSGAGYWRLFAHGVTPNGCWLVAPKLVELVDIDTATGTDVYGTAEVDLDCVPFSYEYIYYNPAADFHFSITATPVNARKA